MSGSAQCDGVILADEEHDWSSGQNQTRKLRSKPGRNGFNCLGFIPVTVLNQRKNANGSRRGARQGLQLVRELTCRFCCKKREKPSTFVAHKRAGLKFHFREKHKNEEPLLNSSQYHYQGKLNGKYYPFVSEQYSWMEEIERYDCTLYSIMSLKKLGLKLSKREVTVELGKSLTKEMTEAVALRQSFQPEVISMFNSR